TGNLRWICPNRSEIDMDFKSKLPIEEIRRVLAAHGWAELGDMDEASREIAAIAPEFQSHPEVLGARWVIHSEAGEWAICVQIASALVRLGANSLQSWVWLAYATRRASPDGIKAAYAILAKAQPRFPTEPLILFNLACYDAQMDNLPRAQDWLSK